MPSAFISFFLLICITKQAHLSNRHQLCALTMCEAEARQVSVLISKVRELVDDCCQLG
jgi:hypothetical protein